MSATLLRLGLYTILIVIAMYVVVQTYDNPQLSEAVPTATLTKALLVGVILVIAGLIASVLEKGAKAVTKNRCAVCKTPIPPGAIYCRAHLRRVLQSEEDRTHMTRTRR